MTLVRPFAAVRPARDKAHLVASRSYVSYSPKDLRDKLFGNPYSFLHIIHPDLGVKKLHKKEVGARLQMVREKFEAFCKEGILEKESKPIFYLYRQIKNGHPFTGLIAGVSVDDYVNGKIKIHEQTLSKRQHTFTQYLEVTGINAEPVLLMSPTLPKLEDVYACYLDQRPEYDFTTTNRDRHQLWMIEDDAHIEEISKIFQSVPALYIADGHHRSASSASLRNLLREKDQENFSPNHPANFFLAYILDETTVRISEFNRLVKDLNGLDTERFLEKLSAHFYITLSPVPFKPAHKGEFGLYLQKQWYCLSLKHSSPELDAQLLSDKVLSPILGIHDLRKDKRVYFMEGPRGDDALRKEVDSGRAVAAFTLFPVSIEALKAIADANQTMPPKSTWVEPKLRSGLVVYEIKEP
jgi:uncharacterized protein (DUF1015 family)